MAIKVVGSVEKLLIRSQTWLDGNQFLCSVDVSRDGYWLFRLTYQEAKDLSSLLMQAAILAEDMLAEAQQRELDL